MEKLPLIQQLNHQYIVFLHTMNYFMLGMILTLPALIYFLYLVYLYQKNQHSKFYILSVQFPEIEASFEEESFQKMRTVLETLQQTLDSQVDKLSLEIYKTDGYITLQIVSNKQEIIEQVASAFGHIQGIKIRVKSTDTIMEMESIYAKSLSTTKPLDTIHLSLDFFPGILHFLSSLKTDEKVGMQVILRAADKRLPIHEKIQSIYNKSRVKNRQLSLLEEQMVTMYQDKQNETLFKVKINILANNKTVLSRFPPLFQPLSTGINRFTMHSESGKYVITRFIAPESLLTSLDFIRKIQGSYLTAGEVSTLYYPTSVLRGLYAPSQMRQIEAPHSFLKKQADTIRIGTIIDNENRKKSIYFPVSNFARHLYLIGKTGRGKSTLLVTLIQSLRQRKEATIFVFDPHGDLVSDIAKQKSEKEVVNLSLQETGLTYTFNPLFSFQTSDNEKASLRDSLLDIIQNETQEQGGQNTTGIATTSRIKYLLSIGIGFADAYYTYLTKKHSLSDEKAKVLISERQLTLNDLPNLLVKEMEYIPVLEEIFQYDESPLGIYIQKQLESHAKQQMVVEAVQNRLEQLLHPSLQLVYEGNKFDLSSAIESEKLFLIPLQETVYGSRGSRVLMQIIFSKLWLLKRQKGTNRNETYVFIDEFQKAQIPAIPEIIAEGRKFKLFLTLSHQQLGQLKEEIKNAILGNIGTLISFTVGADVIGAKTLAPFFGNAVKEKDLISLPPFQAYLKTEGDSQKPSAIFSFETVAIEKIANTIDNNVLIQNKYFESNEEIKKRFFNKQKNPMEYFLGGI